MSNQAQLSPVSAASRVGGFPNPGIVIEGDFAGIQAFVLRPIPGSGGAARRLRARSFRVLALTHLIAREVLARFSDNAAQLVYCAGGRFAVVAKASPEGAARVLRLQQELDEWLLEEFQGELLFHLVCAPADSIIPTELGEKMRAARLRPLRHALNRDGCWQTARFFQPASAAWERCSGCGATAAVTASGDATLCRVCLADTEIGRRLPALKRPAPLERPDGEIGFLGRRYTLVESAERPVPFIAYVPREAGAAITFEALARRSQGRRYLGYLRMDADRIGEAFGNLGRDPEKIRSLSRALNDFFTTELQRTIESSFKDVYPVYSGGDDLLMVGPWDVIVDFAAAVAVLLEKKSSGKLTISGGLSMVKPQEHILTAAHQAEEALKRAKERRNCFHGLNQTLDWPSLNEAIASARRLAEMRRNGKIASAMIYAALSLHERWRDTRLADHSYRSKLFYLIERNTSGEAKEYLSRTMLKPGNEWSSMGFILRYVILATRASEGDEYA